jgi:uncharacterized protein YdbL (DUF1318 family)
MSSYAVSVIPDAHKNALNRVCNLLFSDSGDNLSQPLSANGQAPATHWFGGGPVSAMQSSVFASLQEQASQQGTLGEAVPAPPEGWPYMGVSEADAIAALAALYINVNTGEDAEELPEQNRQTVFAALGLQRVQIEV